MVIGEEPHVGERRGPEGSRPRSVASTSPAPHRRFHSLGRGARDRAHGAASVRGHPIKLCQRFGQKLRTFPGGRQRADAPPSHPAARGSGAPGRASVTAAGVRSAEFVRLSSVVMHDPPSAWRPVPGTREDYGAPRGGVHAAPGIGAIPSVRQCEVGCRHPRGGAVPPGTAATDAHPRDLGCGHVEPSAASSCSRGHRCARLPDRSAPFHPGYSAELGDLTAW